MMILKSIGAILAGIIAGAALSIGTDSVLETAGLMIRDPFNDNPGWLIVIVVFYRSVFNTFGAYITARLAPSQPLRHVLILGGIGLVLGTVGTVVMWDVPPHWYPIALVLLTMPCVWLGGKLAEKKSNSIANP